MRKTDKYYFFYKHILGQWHKFDFTVEGITFNCPEQWMMYQKAILFNDQASADKILLEKHSYQQQQLGRTVKGYKQDKWDAYKFEIVKQGNLHRFRADEEGRKVLFSTAPLILVEASPVDRVWGIGLGEGDPLADDENNWRGSNLLGKALTEVRTILMKEYGAV